MSIVMKFGGTSVADTAAFENVARIVAGEREAMVVVSAMSGVTDSLLAATNKYDASSAFASLDDVFQRHRTVARDLLAPARADEFIAQLNTAAKQIADLLNAF